jgi:hypothetical protein
METQEFRFEDKIVGCVAALCALVLAFLSLMGPLVLGMIRYRTSENAILQVEGQDLVNLVLIVPVCLTGGVLAFRGSPKASRWLMFLPIYLIYMAIAYGIGAEWSDPRYTGNNERYAFFFIFLMIAGIVFLLYSVPRLKAEEAPELGARGKLVYSVLFVAFILIFTGMWSGQILEVMRTGAGGDYDGARTGFWTIRILDMGVSIPLGLLSVYLIWARPKTGFSVQRLFYGFFLTQITAVLAMMLFMFARRDPQADVGKAVVFACIGAIVYAGYFYVTGKRKLAGRGKTM